MKSRGQFSWVNSPPTPTQPISSISSQEIQEQKNLSSEQTLHGWIEDERRKPFPLHLPKLTVTLSNGERSSDFSAAAQFCAVIGCDEIVKWFTHPEKHVKNLIRSTKKKVHFAKVAVFFTNTI